GEHHSAIHHDNVFTVADGGHVHAEFAQSAQGNYLQLQISLQITHSVFTLPLSVAPPGPERLLTDNQPPVTQTTQHSARPGLAVAHANLALVSTRLPAPGSGRP